MSTSMPTNPCSEDFINIPSEGMDTIYSTTNPSHYRNHPSGIECIQITEHMTFCLGNAMKYIWRAGLKDDRKQDLEKAIWYLQRELEREDGVE